MSKVHRVFVRALCDVIGGMLDQKSLGELRNTVIFWDLVLLFLLLRLPIRLQIIRHCLVLCREELVHVAADAWFLNLEPRQLALQIRVLLCHQADLSLVLQLAVDHPVVHLADGFFGHNRLVLQFANFLGVHAIDVSQWH